MDILSEFFLYLLFCNPFSVDEIIFEKDGGKHFLAQLVELKELMKVFTKHL